MPTVVRVNAHGQPIGDALPGWVPPPPPPHTPLAGRFCALRALARDDAAALWEAFGADPTGRNWTYLAHDPFARFDEFAAWVAQASLSTDPLFYVVSIPEGGRTPAGARAVAGGTASSVVGLASYLRITPAAGAIEVGHIHFSPHLQRTPAATEAMYLMMRHVFELGYRRYEWKCDALNAPSRRAAQRLGFSYEGLFRQALVTKGRNRDTAWYACLDREWPALRAAFETWLAPDNFDENGQQRASLAALTAPLLAARG
jgi:RimJ/RimL family protein N-acetyltransferase